MKVCLQEEFGVKYVYAWHSLHGYWAGVAVGKSKDMPYDAQLVMPAPTPGDSLLQMDDIDSIFFLYLCQTYIPMGVPMMGSFPCMP